MIGQYVWFNHAPSFCGRSLLACLLRTHRWYRTNKQNTAFFYRTCFSCRSDMHVSTSASIDIGPLNKTKTNVFHTASFTCAFVKKYMYKHHAASFYMCVQSKSKYMYKQHEVSFTCAFNQNQNTCINKHLFGGPSSKATKAYCKSLCSIGCQGYNLLNRSSWK